MKKELNVRIHFYLTCLLAFLLPILPIVIPPVIALLLLNWIAGGNFLKLFQKRTNRMYFILFVSLYLFYLAGMLWSENKEYGLKDLETKLSLLIFPLIYFSSEPLDRKKLSGVFLSLTWGCLTAAVICLGYAIFQYFQVRYLLAHNIWAWDYGINFFLKDRLSFLIHPSYISMYFIIALAGLHWLKPEWPASSSWKRFVIPFILSVFILLFSSKAGILSLLIWGMYIGWHAIFREGKIKPAIIGAMALTTVFLVLYFSAPQFALRINNTVYTLTEKAKEKNSEESTASRIAVWKAAGEVITRNTIIGTGTGDVKDELMKEYEKQGMTFAWQENLNAHSQFIQTFITLGLPGFLIFCLGFFFPLYHESKNRNYLFVTFIILIVFNFIAESMLETQAGVVFYAFFNSLLLFSEPVPSIGSEK